MQHSHVRYTVRSLQDIRYNLFAPNSVVQTTLGNFHDDTKKHEKLQRTNLMITVFVKTNIVVEKYF